MHGSRRRQRSWRSALQEPLSWVGPRLRSPTALQADTWSQAAAKGHNSQSPKHTCPLASKSTVSDLLVRHGGARMHSSEENISLKHPRTPGGKWNQHFLPRASSRAAPSALQRHRQGGRWHLALPVPSQLLTHGQPECPPVLPEGSAPSPPEKRAPPALASQGFSSPKAVSPAGHRAKATPASYTIWSD